MTKTTEAATGTIQWYIDNKLVHSLHTSVRKSFRSCRRRWKWAYIDKFYPRVTPAPLEFGVAFHAAMEVFYDPRTWHQLLDVRQALALVKFKQTCEAQLRNFTKLNGEPETTVLDEYKERIKLGLNMIRYYTEHVSPFTDVGFTPIEVEVPFEIPITNPDTKQVLYCTCGECWTKQVNYLKKHDPEFLSFADKFKEKWHGLPVTYGGRLDMLAKDDQGRYWIYDWKQLTVDSPVLTPKGWSKMGELQVGDLVIGSTGRPTKVTGVYPKGLHEVYEVVFRDGTIVECSKDHAWYVKSTQFGKFSVKETQDIMNKPGYENYAVPLPTGPIEFDSQDVPLPMHPYVLGSLLGDGCFTGNGLTFSSQSGETVELLNKYHGDETKITDQRHHGGNKWQITGPWKSQLQELNLWTCRSGTKFIPSRYLTASVQDRILLLQGLVDTDGNTGILRITTTSKMLADDIRELIWSLGGDAYYNVSKERVHQNGTTINVPEYFINYWLPEWIEPNQLERKRVGRKARTKGMHRGIKEVRATGIEKEMLCIRVEAEDHLYITNNFILTHNTTSRIMDEDSESSFLTLDDQIASYVWGLRLLGLPVAGFVYVEIKKAYPTTPDELSRLYKGRKYSTSKTLMTTPEIYRRFVSEHDPFAYAEGVYDDHIAWLKREGPKFHQRHQIHKNDHEVDEVGRNIFLEASDIIGDPKIYPQPGRFSCQTCLYRQPCIGQNQGEDYMYTLSSLFEKKERNYYDEQPSTDRST